MMTYFFNFFFFILFYIANSSCKDFSMSAAELAELERDASFLTENVATTGPGVGQYVGGMTLFGKYALPLASERNAVVWASSRFPGRSGGKICAFSQTKFCQLNDVQLEMQDNARSIDNCIKWITNKTSPSSSLSSTVGLIATSTTFNRGGFKRSTKTAFENDADLVGVDFVMVYGWYLDTQEKTLALRNFLIKGGGLIICSTPWNKRNMASWNANLLLFNAGIVYPNDISRLSDSVTVTRPSFGNLWRQNLWYAAATLIRSNNIFENIQTKPTPVDAFTDLINGIPNFLIDLPQPSQFGSQFYQAIGATQIYDQQCKSRSQAFPISLVKQPMEYNCVKFAQLIRFIIPANRDHPIVKAAQRFPGNPTGVREIKSVTRRISLNLSRLQSLDLYVWPGSRLQIVVSDNVIDKNGTEIIIGCHSDDLMVKNEFKRWPILTETVPIQKKNTTVYTLTGGLLYLNVPASVQNTGQFVEITMVGELVSSVRFKLGQTSDSDWKRDTTATQSPWLEIETDYLILTLPTRETKTWTRNIGNSALWQNDAMKLIYDLSGSQSKGYKDRYVTDVQSKNGMAHAGYPITVGDNYNGDYVLSENSWAKSILTPSASVTSLPSLSQNFPEKSHWGILHELGHNFQSPYWTSAEEMEVTANIFPLYVEEMYPSGPGQFGAMKLDPESRKSETQFYQMLGFYVDLRLAFGWEPFRQFFRRFPSCSSTTNCDTVNRPKSVADVNDNWLKYFSQIVKRDIGAAMKMFNKTVSSDARLAASEYPSWNVDFVIDCEIVAIPNQSPCATLYVRPDRSLLYRMVTWSRIHDRERLVLTFEGIDNVDSLKGFTVTGKIGAPVESFYYNATLRSLSIEIKSKVAPSARLEMVLTPTGTGRYSFDNVKVKVKIMAAHTIVHVQERFLEGVHKKAVF